MNSQAKKRQTDVLNSLYGGTGGVGGGGGGLSSSFANLLAGKQGRIVFLYGTHPPPINLPGTYEKLSCKGEYNLFSG